MRIDRKRVALEFTSIVVAVILAMSLSEMRQNYLNKRLAQRSFNSIIAEVQSNQDELKGDSVKLSKDLNFIKKWVSDVKNDVEHESFSTTFSLSFLSESARDVAETNQSLTHLSNEQNLAIAEVYATHDFYAQQGSKMFDLMGEMISNMGESDAKKLLPHVQALKFHMNLIFSTVKAYLEESKEFLSQYATDLPTSH